MFTGRGSQRRVAALAALCLIASLFAVPASADPNSQLQKIQSKKQRQEERRARLEARASVLSDKVVDLDTRRAQVESEVNALDADLAALERDITTTKKELARAQTRLAILTEDLYRVLADLDERTEAFTERAVAAYMAGPSAYVDTILSSESISEMVDRQTYYESALNSDSQLLAEIDELRAATEVRRELVIEKQEEIISAKSALEEKQTRIARVREERGAVLAQRQEMVRAKQSTLSNVRNKESKAKALLAQLQRDENQVRAIIAAQTAGHSGAAKSVGRFVWPASGPLTSAYGMRTHPIFGDVRMHTGIDIGAPYGSAVYAADGGRVIYVGAMSGYGNVVIIDHGGIATTYNHLSSYAVSSGQSVGRGSVVGGVGCSGYCTGPHLHFEVRIGGNTVDPMPYFQ